MTGSRKGDPESMAKRLMKEGLDGAAVRRIGRSLHANGERRAKVFKLWVGNRSNGKSNGK